MAKLSDEMKAMIKTQQCFVATVDENGYPNIAPKGTTRVLDDETIIFTETTGGRTLSNLKTNPKVAVAVVNRETLDGYRFAGRAELVQEGELFDKAAAATQKAGYPMPKAVVKITVESIYSLKPSAAGKKIG